MAADCFALFKKIMALLIFLVEKPEATIFLAFPHYLLCFLINFS